MECPLCKHDSTASATDARSLTVRKNVGPSIGTLGASSGHSGGATGARVVMPPQMQTPRLSSNAKERHAAGESGCSRNKKVKSPARRWIAHGASRTALPQQGARKKFTMPKKLGSKQDAHTAARPHGGIVEEMQAGMGTSRRARRLCCFVSKKRRRAQAIFCRMKARTRKEKLHKRMLSSGDDIGSPHLSSRGKSSLRKMRMWHHAQYIHNYLYI